MPQYAVTLLYPEYFSDFGYATYCDIVDAENAEAAVTKVQHLAADANGDAVDDPTDFHPLSVVSGIDLTFEEE